MKYSTQKKDNFISHIREQEETKNSVEWGVCIHVKTLTEQIECNGYEPSDCVNADTIFNAFAVVFYRSFLENSRYIRFLVSTFCLFVPTSLNLISEIFVITLRRETNWVSSKRDNFFFYYGRQIKKKEKTAQKRLIQEEKVHTYPLRV